MAPSAPDTSIRVVTTKLPSTVLLIRELISKDDSGYKLYTVPSGTGKEVYLPVHGSVISIDTLDVIAGDLPSHALGTGFSFSSTMRQTARPNSAREAHRL
jgi:hypothetical protein